MLCFLLNTAWLSETASPPHGRVLSFLVVCSLVRCPCLKLLDCANKTLPVVSLTSSFLLPNPLAPISQHMSNEPKSVADLAALSVLPSYEIDDKSFEKESAVRDVNVSHPLLIRLRLHF